jgi:hypothetical protein
LESKDNKFDLEKISNTEETPTLNIDETKNIPLLEQDDKEKQKNENREKFDDKESLEVRDIEKTTDVIEDQSHTIETVTTDSGITSESAESMSTTDGSIEIKASSVNGDIEKTTYVMKVQTHMIESETTDSEIATEPTESNNSQTTDEPVKMKASLKMRDTEKTTNTAEDQTHVELKSIDFEITTEALELKGSQTTDESVQIEVSPDKGDIEETSVSIVLTQEPDKKEATFRFSLETTQSNRKNSSSGSIAPSKEQNLYSDKRSNQETRTNELEQKSHIKGSSSCNYMICPDGAVLCRISFRSLPPDFKQMFKKSECLSKTHEILRSTEVLEENPHVGNFYMNTETYPVSHNLPRSLYFGDFFAGN